MPDLTVTLEFGEKRWFSSASDKGAFVFERLAEGEYTLSVSAPAESQPLIPPHQIHVSKGGCVSELLNVPKSALPKH